MAEIYGKKTGLCGGFGGSMHLADPERGFLGTSGIVGAGDPPRDRRRLRRPDPQAGPGRAVLLRRRRVQAGRVRRVAEHRSLWKLPIVFVMENNNYNVVTRIEQEDANAAAGEPLAVKAKAFACPGSRSTAATRSRSTAPCARRSTRARSGEGPTLVESKVYRLSAHGNIIAPPGVPLHFPEHEAIKVFGAPRGVRGRPARRPRAALPRPADHARAR